MPRGKKVPHDKLKIGREKFPKARRSWTRKPVTKIKESGRKYKRPNIKKNTRKATNNAKG